MATTQVTLNGVTYPKCANESREDAIIGTAYEAADGTRRFARRARKQKYMLEFQGLTITELNALRNVQALTTSFPYVNGHGVSATVICRNDPLTSEVAVIDLATDPRYNATLTLWEV